MHSVDQMLANVGLAKTLHIIYIIHMCILALELLAHNLMKYV